MLAILATAAVFFTVLLAREEKFWEQRCRKQEM